MDEGQCPPPDGNRDPLGGKKELLEQEALKR